MANFFGSFFKQVEKPQSVHSPSVQHEFSQYDSEYIKYCIEQEQTISKLETCLHTTDDPKEIASLDFQVTPHQLRHTYITNLIYASVDPKTVQYLAGHENSRITMDIYAKVKYNKPEQLSAVVNTAFGQPA